MKRSLFNLTAQLECFISSCRKLTSVSKTYRIRTNIGGYNIWRFIEIMNLARYKFGEIIQKQLGSQLIFHRKTLARFKLGDCMAIRQI